jgi:hypothetical protein
MSEISKEQREELTRLVKELANIASNSGQGRMHGFWDVVYDIDAFLNGKATILKHSADEWISYAEGLLKKHGRK